MKISEDLPKPNTEKEIIQNENSPNKNFVNQIDDIINKYKTQLQQLKINTSQNNQEKKDEILPKLTTISKNLDSSLLAPSSPETKKDNYNIPDFPVSAPLIVFPFLLYNN